MLGLIRSLFHKKQEPPALNSLASLRLACNEVHGSTAIKPKKSPIETLVEKVIKKPKRAWHIDPVNQTITEIEFNNENQLLDEMVGPGRCAYNFDNFSTIYWDPEKAGTRAFYFENMVLEDFSERKFSNGIIIANSDDNLIDADELNYWLRFVDTTSGRY
jgi:hypothetical protein